MNRSCRALTASEPSGAGEGGAPAPASPAVNENPSFQAGNIGVLIADNDQGTRAFYNTALTKAGGYNVLTAATCQEALDILAKMGTTTLNIVVFDLAEEGLDGHLLLQKIRLEPKYLGLDILIASDNLSDEDQFLLKELDIRYFMKKKSGTGEFISKLSQIIKDQKEKSGFRSKVKELEAALVSGDITKCDEVVNSPELANFLENEPELVPFRGELSLLKQQVDSAIELLSNFLHTCAEGGKPETFRALSVLGKALCQANRYEEAFSVFDRLARKSPANLSHKLGKADAMLGTGDVKGAQAEYQGILEVDPSNKDAQVGIGKSKLASGDTEGAFSVFQKIKGPIESYSLASYFNNAAVTLVRNGKVNEAMRLYDRALQYFDKYKAHIYFNMGMAKIRQGQVMPACKCFDEVIKRDNTGLAERKSILKEYKEKGLPYMMMKYSIRPAGGEGGEPGT